MTYFSTFSLNFNNQKKLDKHDGLKDYHKIVIQTSVN